MKTGFLVTLLSIAVSGGVLAQPAGEITITGILTDAGVECRAMQGDDGVLYTMRRVPALSQLRTGDRIKVTGKMAQVSTCQQGKTIDNPKIQAPD